MSLDISDWLCTPAPFNLKKHGPNAIFSGDNSIVERREPENYHAGCVCYEGSETAEISYALPEIRYQKSEIRYQKTSFPILKMGVFW